MAQEIERKFLVAGDFSKGVSCSLPIVQGYLCSDARRTVRVRVCGDSGFITVKGASDESGLSRFEWEKEIPASDAMSLLELALPGVISKTRHLVPCPDGVHTWEVDEFHGDNEGLLLAEIELSSEDEAFERPDWLGKEVTGDPTYYNSALSRNPYKNWNR